MEAYTFRITLILLGGGLIFGLLLWDRWRKNRRRKERIEPSLGSEEDLLHSGLDVPDQHLAFPMDLDTAAKKQPEELLVQFRVVAKASAGFAGQALQAAFQEQAMAHGALRLYHRESAGQTLFSAASLVEPGYFDVAMMAKQTYPGVLFFMRLPGPEDGIATFRALLQAIHSLAHRLDGNIQDSAGHPLAQHTLEQLQIEITNFQQRFPAKENLPS